MLISSLSAIEVDNTLLHIQLSTGVPLVQLSEDFEDDNNLSLDTNISSSFESYSNNRDKVNDTDKNRHIIAACHHFSSSTAREIRLK